MPATPLLSVTPPPNAVHKCVRLLPGCMDVSVSATGHDNVTARHDSTLELTTDDFLTPAGDCILGIDADCSPAAFSDAFVAACQDAAATITLVLDTPQHRDEITGSGHPDLTFTNDRSMVGRTSTYVDDRTVFVDADKAAADVDRELVAALADGAPLTATLRVD
ncbi:hypothetical protein HNR49_001153 [Halobacterium salinarum]|nr:hypothetical protein [Halobacterium salinarum]